MTIPTDLNYPYHPVVLALRRFAFLPTTLLESAVCFFCKTSFQVKPEFNLDYQREKA